MTVLGGNPTITYAHAKVLNAGVDAATGSG